MSEISSNSMGITGTARWVRVQYDGTNRVTKVAAAGSAPSESTWNGITESWGGDGGGMIGFRFAETNQFGVDDVTAKSWNGSAWVTEHGYPRT